jgi:hypothetical protein
MLLYGGIFLLSPSYGWRTIEYDKDEDYWLTEVSGIPFGLMGEMLQDGGHLTVDYYMDDNPYVWRN